MAVVGSCCCGVVICVVANVIGNFIFIVIANVNVIVIAKCCKAMTILSAIDDVNLLFAIPIAQHYVLTTPHL